MTCDIVIVNWNSGCQLQDCINSIRKYHGGGLGRCIVVDNGSSDGSVAFLSEAVDVDLVLAGQNLGFGRACNLGAERGISPFILFLNPDACLMLRALDVPIRFLSNPDHRKVGIVGVALVDDAGMVQRSCTRFPTVGHMLLKSFGVAALLPRTDYFMRDWDHSFTRRVDHVIGAFFLIRREVFAGLEGFDERFFVYLEDLDLSRRAASAGFETFFLTEARAYHKGGGVSDQVKAHRLFYSIRSRILYSFKHFGQFPAIGVSLAALFVEPLTRLMFLALRGRFGEIWDLLRGYRMLWGWSLGRLLGRRVDG